MVRFFLSLFGILFLLGDVCVAQTSQAQLQNCLIKAKAGKDPAERDDAKFGCIQQFNQNISVERCAQIASMMEYTSTGDEVRKYCIFDLKANATFAQCMNVAHSAEYGENGDEIRWQCIRILSPNSSKKDCLKVSKQMVLPYNKRRSVEICDVSY